jgi:hypothetical protein
VHICTLFKAYSGEGAWKNTGDRLPRPCYTSRDDHDWKIRARNQRALINKYLFVERVIRLWNKLPAEALATLHRRQHIFRKRVKKVIISALLENSAVTGMVDLSTQMKEMLV